MSSFRLLAETGKNNLICFQKGEINTLLHINRPIQGLLKAAEICILEKHREKLGQLQWSMSDKNQLKN